MVESNPKQHDKLFKWMLAEFTDEFFAFFFPGVRVGNHRLLDKEFYRELEKEEASTEADLLLLMEVLLNDRPREILIVIEHKNTREDVQRQIEAYACRAFLLRRKPVWCIAFFTDDANWREPLPNRFPFAFHSEEGLIEVPFDIIKLREHESATLVRHRSLLVRLLALKADDSGIQRDQLVSEIYRYVQEHEGELTDQQKILVEKVVEAYAALPPIRVRKIKKEVGMAFVASNIEEHFIHIGEQRGEQRGKQLGKQLGEKIGEQRGRILGAIDHLKDLLIEGIITHKYYKEKVTFFENQLAELEAKDEST